MPVYSTDNNLIFPYLTDESFAFSGHADRVYFPTDADEVAAILREATKGQTGVSISGGGTSITGARVPTTGGWILATDRLRSAIAPPPESAGEQWTRQTAGDGSVYLDINRMRARVPAGIRLSELDSILAPHGLIYPPTLTETSAMVGGTIATNASGARSYHYGPTRAWVQALSLVTPRGEVLQLRRGQPGAEEGVLRLAEAVAPVNLPHLPHLSGVKNAAGYFVNPGMEAIDLFVGGEGTLGVVVEAEVGLAPRPGNAVTLLVFVRERDAALDFADAVREGAFDPWTALAVEYFDAASLEFMRESYEEIPQAAAAVLVEVAPLEDRGLHWFGDARTVHPWLQVTNAFDPVDVWAILPTEREQVRLFRHSLPGRINEYVRTRGGKLGTDFAVPASAFRRMMAAYDDAADAGIRTVLFGHLGEYHLHLNFLVNDAAELDTARDRYVSLVRTAVDLGGTVSAEHGVGKKRIRLSPDSSVPYLEVMYGADGMRGLRMLKSQLDPAWILNRDTMIPWDGGP